MNGSQSKDRNLHTIINAPGKEPVKEIFAGLRIKRHSKGFILMSVMLLCVMLVASATAYAWYARTQMKSLFQEKLALQTRGIAYILTLEVINGLKLVTKASDSIHDPWFQPMLVPLKDFGVANVSLKPLDNKIPINHLFPSSNNINPRVSMGWEEIWKKMWIELGERGGSLQDKVLDYIDKDTVPRAMGRDGPDNLNRDLFDISELLGIPEITPELLYGEPLKLGLTDYCTMWSGDKININTVEPQVLALFENMNRYIVEEVMKYRAEKEITSLDDLRRDIPSFPRNLASSQFIIEFKSSYFNLKIELLDENWNSTRYFDIVLYKKDGNIVIKRWEEI